MRLVATVNNYTPCRHAITIGWSLSIAVLLIAGGCGQESAATVPGRYCCNFERSLEHMTSITQADGASANSTSAVTRTLQRLESAVLRQSQLPCLELQPGGSAVLVGWDGRSLDGSWSVQAGEVTFISSASSGGQVILYLRVNDGCLEVSPETGTLFDGLSFCIEP